MPARTPPPRAVDAVLATRRRLLRAADALLPPWAVMWELTMGLERTHVVAALAELGIPEALKGRRGRTADDVASDLDLDADALHRVLRAAAVHGIVRVDRRGRFRLTRVGRTLRREDPASLSSWARYLALPSTRAAWAGLTDVVRTGRPAFPDVHGTSVWRWFADHPAEERLFADSMRAITEFDTPGLAAVPLWPAEGRLCDVAGGVGTLLAAVLETRPGLRGVLVDAPGVLSEAEAHLAARGVRDRVELVPGDLFGSIDVEADTYVLKNVLHDWDDDTAGRILATVRAAMPAGARLLVVEQTLERDEPHPFAALSDLQMLTQCDGGRERSRGELERLLTGAGLLPGRVARSGTSAVFEGVAPWRRARG